MAATFKAPPNLATSGTPKSGSANFIELPSTIQNTSVTSKVDFEEDAGQDFTESPASPEDQIFDLIIGILEDLLMDDEFIAFQKKFMNKNYKHFSTTDDENKLIYMEIFKSYTAKVEEYIEKQLSRQIQNFKMSDFLSLLRSRPEQLEGDVFDMLASIGDFEAFKEMMIEYKKEKEGSGIDLSGLLAVTNVKSRK